MIRFLDPSMLLFCLAVGLPPIIAWLGRRGAATREWAAMEILARAADRSAFRRRCIDWLVVAVRSAMLLAVAFAAARPFFVPSASPAEPSTNGGVPRERRAVVVGEATAVAAALESAAPALASVKSITESQFTEAQFNDEPFEEASLVVLADGVVPGPAAARRVGRFVDRGGAVALLVGPRTTAGAAAAFNRFAGALAGVEIDGAVDRPAFAAGGDVLARETVRLTATADGDAEMNLTGPTVRRTARLVIGHVRPGATAGPHRPPAVLARTIPSGDPLALRVGVGRGAVGIIAVPLAIEGWSGGGWAADMTPASSSPAAWTDLPAWPVFLPFVERTILSLMTAGGEAIGDEEAGMAGWLAGRNLSGLALVAALALVLLDPLLSRSAGPWNRNR